MATICVVEDDKNIREIEAFSLKNSGYEVKEFEVAKDFYQAVTEKIPDLVLLDIMLPDADGLDIVKALRVGIKTKNIPIIMVTAKTSEIDKVKGLDMGADDYIAKPFGIMELISRVKALLRRSSAEAYDKVITDGIVCIDEEKHKVSVGEETCELTFKEYELLKLLLSHADTVVSRETILEKVWGTDFEGESRTLDMHIKTLRQKLLEAGARIKGTIDL